MSVDIRVKVEGGEYVGEVMEIAGVELVPWGDDRIRVNVDFLAGCTGQGTGSFTLGGDRLVEWLRGLMLVADASDMREVPGSLVIVLRKLRSGPIYGVMNPTQEERYFMFRNDSDE